MAGPSTGQGHIHPANRDPYMPNGITHYHNKLYELFRSPNPGEITGQCALTKTITKTMPVHECDDKCTWNWKTRRYEVYATPEENAYMETLLAPAMSIDNGNSDAPPGATRRRCTCPPSGRR